MKVGTKSVLFGAHQFLIHPLVLAIAWWKLYGFPWDPRLWVVFFVHDLGYWGCPNMDGEEGEMHPWCGANFVSRLFDSHRVPRQDMEFIDDGLVNREGPLLGEWGRFSLLHSRFLAKRYMRKPSRLCVADKLAICLEPWWLYLPRVMLSGELPEYMAECQGDGKYADENRATTSKREWHRTMVTFLRGWVKDHKNGDLAPMPR